MKKQIFIFITLLFSSLLWIDAAASKKVAINEDNLPLLPKTDPSATQIKSTAPNTKLVRDFCPPVQSLVRDPKTQNWSAPSGWKTTSPAFLRSLDSFVGAQWVGVSIGEVICIYTKSSRNSFPVMLQRGKLVPAPSSGGAWSEDKGGYMECKSNEIKQCPFFIQVPKKEENVYEQLDFYKGKPVESGD